MDGSRGAKVRQKDGHCRDYPLAAREGNTETYDEISTVDEDSAAAEQEIGQIAGIVSFQSHHHPQYDRRKHSITTTPTLVDEIETETEIEIEIDTSDDDEADDDEMVSLERERLKRVSKQKEDAAAFKTASLRRTPGAHAMRQSAGADVLGFGLALSSPIGTKNTKPTGNFSPSNSFSSNRSPIVSERPPRDPNSARELISYTPASYALSKNPHLEVNHGSFSPNTLRLTEDLDNLLDEGEGEETPENNLPTGHTVTQFRQTPEQLGVERDAQDGVQPDLAESWTSSYIFAAEGGTGTRKPNKTHGRNTRASSGRRSRNLESPKAFRPVEVEAQKPVNFGGAFAAPQNFQRPVPSHESQWMLKPTPQGALEPTLQQQFNYHAFAPHDPRINCDYGYNGVYQQHQQPQPIRRPVLHNTTYAQQQLPLQQPPYVPQPWNQSIRQQNPLEFARPSQNDWNDSSYNYGVDSIPGNSGHPFVQYQYWQDQGIDQPSYGAHMLPPNQKSQHQANAAAPISEPCEFAPLNADQETSSSTRREKKNQKHQKKNQKNQQNKKIEKQRKEGNKKKNIQTGKRGNKGKKVETDPAESKKAELNENPATRAAFKEFNRNFRIKERESFGQAEAYAHQALEEESIPSRVHWRIFLELADLAKRSNRFNEARRLYSKVCELQPYASQGWLEHSKLEEECGNLNKCTQILMEGLQYCEFSETLLTRAIKHAEKMGNLRRARELLARLKHVGIEKVWRSVLEGALLEARAGNHLMARRVLKYLMHHVPWYGPLYLEAYRLERDLGRSVEALQIVERGLKAIPRYGPLWFGAFRLCETLDLSDSASNLPRTHMMFERATNNINKELIWKVHLEAAQILERAASWFGESYPPSKMNSLLDPCRKRIAMTALSCPQNLLWKVWLAGGRMELLAGNVERARRFILRAHYVVPEKGRVTTMLECARLEEFVGETDLARAILCKCRGRYKSEWKVWLESVLIENRSGNYLRAVDLVREALEFHSGTGRLWAALVQLSYASGGEDGQFLSLKCALKAVPKSGEVWCEGARILLNPFSKSFDPLEARRHLQFATRFTPQYGDSFVETLRLEAIERWALPIAYVAWEAIKDSLSNLQKSHEWFSEAVARSSKLVLALRDETMMSDIDDKIQDKSVIPSLRAQLEYMNFTELFQSSDLELRCANADPNYGLLWFHCRHSPTDTARTVLEKAQAKIIGDLKNNIHIYVAAIVRRYAVILSAGDSTKSDGSESNEDARNEGYPLFESLLREVSSTDEILRSNGLLNSSVSGFDFVIGLQALNRSRTVHEETFLQRKKILFGSDALFS